MAHTYPTGETSGFTTAYGDTPWEDFDKNQRTVYVPELLETFRHKSLFYGLVTYGVNLAAARTNRMVFTQVIDPEPNIGQLDNRAIWLPQIYLDSRSIEITCARYGDKIMLNKYDELITYWQENGQAGLRRIIRGRLAPHMVQSLDILARNAFLSKTTVMFAGGASSFGSLQSDDTFELGVVRAVHLNADYQPDPVDNPIIAITSPSAIYTIRNDDTGEFISRVKYADARRLVNYEVGEYEGVRFAKHPTMTLWNCGEVLAQTTITASINLGDGAPDPDSGSTADKVDGVWMVGQSGATHYITVADTSDFEVGDLVTLHTYRPSSNGTMQVQNGVKFDHPENIVREVHAIPSSTRLVFTEPITVDYYQTDLGGGVYGYVTKARPVHACVFIKGPRGVVSGVLQPPQTYTPPPVDDTESIYRFAWDARMKYQQMYPRRFDVYFFAGPIVKRGQVVNL